MEVAAHVIRLFCRFKYTITLSLVLAALIAWAAWRQEWWRVADAGAGGVGGAAYVVLSDLVRRWHRKRRAARR